MTVPGTKLSQIPLAGSPPALTDTVVGVQTIGPVDLRYTLAQIQTAIVTGSGTPAPPLNAVQFNNPLGTFDGSGQFLWIQGAELPVTPGSGFGLQIGGANSSAPYPDPSGLGQGAGGHIAVGNWALIDQARYGPGDFGEDSGWFPLYSLMTMIEKVGPADLSIGLDGVAAQYISINAVHTGTDPTGLSGIGGNLNIGQASSGPVGQIIAFGIIPANLGSGPVAQIIGASLAPTQINGGLVTEMDAVFCEPFISSVGSDTAVTTIVGASIQSVYGHEASNIAISNGAGFTATGTGTSLVVTGVTGIIDTNSIVITGAGVPAGTQIVAQVSGTPGGAGTYTTNNSTTSSGAFLTQGGNYGVRIFTPFMDLLGPVSISNNWGVYIEDQTAAGIQAIASAPGSGYSFVGLGVFENFHSAGAASINWLEGTTNIGLTGVNTGKLSFYGITSGSVTVQAQDIAGTPWTFQLPNLPGTQGEVLQTDGTGLTRWAPFIQIADSSVPAAQGTNLVYFIDPTSGNDANSGILAAQFTGSITTTTLTVTAIAQGALAVGQTIFQQIGVIPSPITAGTKITALGSGTGGTGTYILNNSQTVGSQTLMSSLPFQTLQHALNVAAMFDYGPNNFSAVFIIAKGTLPEAIGVPNVIGLNPQNGWQIFGASSTDTILDESLVGGFSTILASGSSCAKTFWNGMTLKGDFVLAFVQNGANLEFSSDVAFVNAPGAQVVFSAQSRAVMFLPPAISITGDAGFACFNLGAGGNIQAESPITITFIGSPNLTNFALLDGYSDLSLIGATFVGATTTTQKFGLTNYSLIDTDVAYASWPGGIDGTGDLTSAYAGAYIDDTVVVTAPTTGAHVTARPFQGCSILTPAAPILAVTPQDLPANPIDGQPFIISTTQAIANVTVATTDGSAIGLVTNPFSLASDGDRRLRYNAAANTWYPG